GLRPRSCQETGQRDRELTYAPFRVRPFFCPLRRPSTRRPCGKVISALATSALATSALATSALATSALATSALATSPASAKLEFSPEERPSSSIKVRLVFCRWP